MKINVKFIENNEYLPVIFDESDESVETSFGDYQTVTECVGGTPYDGDYVVTPKVDSQIMATKEKVMVDDVTIKAIPFFNVSNTSGGSTVYIANEV